MTRAVKIGFKAFDPHELLCHLTALEAGFYQRHGIDVELFDLTFTEDDELPADLCQVSCGAALASILRGNPQKVVFVACDRPMFWIYARGGNHRLEQLAGRKMATYPPTAPPHHLANMALREHGIDAGRALTLRAARDDNARFGLLLSGSVDAAVISSAIAPAKIEAAGMHRLCCIGDEIRLPSTGLAVPAAFMQREPRLVRVLTEILRQGLAAVHGDDVLTAAVLQKFFAYEESTAGPALRYFRRCFTHDGRTSETIAAKAISAMGRSLAVADLPGWDEIYTFPGLA